MLYFTVDKELCVSCGACAEDCLPQAIQMEGEYPSIPNEEHCMRCLHCLAVCPTGAISILGHDPAESEPLKGRLPAPEQVATLMKGRRSVRRYKQENVDPALLRRVLDVAAHAPTGVNARQLWVTVIDDTASMDAFRKEVYQRLEDLVRENRMPENPRRQFFSSAPELWRKGLDPIFRHAPHCILVSNAKDAPCREQDSLIYLSYFELMAQSGGLGTVWCGLLYWCLRLVLPELIPRLGIPETHELGYAMLFGSPAVQYQRTAERGPADVHRVIWPAR
ncbi:nitroreductase [Desulfovibrio sp. PG-178-WT-4]|uniref:Nitroreductase n=1 Tax=Desulfovibrio porci TaxID=2605782 RepID=A0A6L5XK46_9BACT|nr:nitroreductase family protein [Desulfovibrio porci]MSS27603.1 nitroreductase [Desulfovibrio porci]